MGGCASKPKDLDTKKVPAPVEAPAAPSETPATTEKAQPTVAADKVEAEPAVAADKVEAETVKEVSIVLSNLLICKLQCLEMFLSFCLTFSSFFLPMQYSPLFLFINHFSEFILVPYYLSL